MYKRYVIAFLLIITINFFLPRTMKADPFLFLSSEGGEDILTFTEEQIEEYKEYYGLDQSLGKQFIDYLKNIMTFNLGYSIYMKRPVLSIIGSRIFWTLGIVFASLVISGILGVFLGGLSGWYRDTSFDGILYPFMVAMSQVPSFIIGFIILVIFSIKIRILPVAGGYSPFADLGFNLETIIDILKHGTLPTLTLSLVRLPEFYILARNSFIEEMKKPYVLTAKAKGIKDFVIIFKHCLKNSINPIMTKFLIGLATVFNGALVIENVFNYPGVGRLMRESVFLRDYTLMQGIFLIITLLTLIFSYISEVFYKKGKYA